MLWKILTSVLSSYIEKSWGRSSVTRRSIFCGFWFSSRKLFIGSISQKAADIRDQSGLSKF